MILSESGIPLGAVQCDLLFDFENNILDAPSAMPLYHLDLEHFSSEHSRMQMVIIIKQNISISISTAVSVVSHVKYKIQ